MSTTVKLVHQPIVFPNDLFIASTKSDDPSATPKYGCVVLIAKDDPQLATIKAAITEAAKAKWGAKADQTLKAIQAVGRGGLSDGDLKTWSGFEGHWYISPKNVARPLLINHDKTPLTREDGVLYSGAICNFKLEVYAYDNPKAGAKGIAWSLLGVQFAKDGQRYGGSSVASADDFDIEVGATADDLA